MWRFWDDYDDESVDGGSFKRRYQNQIVLIRLFEKSAEVYETKIYDSFEL